MRFATRRPRLFVALAAAALSALALTLVPGALADNKKGDRHPSPAPAVAGDTLLKRGATTVALNPDTVDILDELGVSLAPVGPASAGKDGISFPITFGLVDSATLAGQIRHSGGLKATNEDGTVTVYLTRYFIDINDAPALTGLVGGAPYEGDRAALFNLDLTGLEVTAKRRYIMLGGIDLTLTDDAAAALNAAFGVTAFEGGLPIGTATVKARVRTKGL